MKKRILPILAGLWPYLLFAVFLYIKLTPTQPHEPVSQVPIICIFSILLLAPVLAMICLLWGMISHTLSPATLAKWGLAVKLAHIPFYVTVFCFFLFLPVFGTFFFVFDAMAMTVGSGFGIAAILRARKEGLLTTVRTIGHIIAHCFFIADVISAFLIWKRLRTASVTN